MSGKTVFLKQLAVTQILAQMGSFIPAEREGSVVRLMEHLFFISGSASDSSAVDECSQFESSVRQMIHMLKSKSGTPYRKGSSFVITEQKFCLNVSLFNRISENKLIDLREDILLSKFLIGELGRCKNISPMENLLFRFFRCSCLFRLYFNVYLIKLVTICS